nr:hypothetical protein [Pseudonocardia oceani]
MVVLAAAGLVTDQVLGQTSAQLERRTDSQHDATGMLGEPAAAAAGVAKKCTWLQNPDRTPTPASGMRTDTTAVSGSSSVTPAVGSTLRRTSSPVPGVGETTCAGRSRTVGKIKVSSAHHV